MKSELGQMATPRRVNHMSALPPKADIVNVLTTASAGAKPARQSTR